MEVIKTLRTRERVECLCNAIVECNCMMLTALGVRRLVMLVRAPDAFDDLMDEFAEVDEAKDEAAHANRPIWRKALDAVESVPARIREQADEDVRAGLWR
jgi:hypothetical protein